MVSGTVKDERADPVVIRRLDRETVGGDDPDLFVKTDH